MAKRVKKEPGQELLNDHEAQFLLKQRGDLAGFFENFLKIKTKDATIKKFKLNVGQRIVQAGWEYQMRTQGYVRMIILKARQGHGCSTHGAAILFAMGLLYRNTSCVMVADNDDNGTVLFEKQALFYESLPQVIELKFEELGESYLIDFKPKKKYSTKQELVFDILKSDIRVLTAGTKRVGQSRTIRHQWLTEVPYWPNDSAAYTSLTNAMPSSPSAIKGTSLVMEGTANGMQGIFYHRWRKRRDGFLRIFLPWYLADEFIRKVPDPVYWPEGTTELIYEQGEPDLEYWDGDTEAADEELQLAHMSAEKIKSVILPRGEFNHGIKMAGITPEQLAWRRFCIAEQTETLDMFHQEYPSTAEEAWLHSGARFIKPKDILWHSRLDKPVPIKGDLYYVKLGGVVFVPSDIGNWTMFNYDVTVDDGGKKIYRLKDTRFAVGVDVVEGRDAGLEAGRDSDLDYSVAYVAGVETNSTAMMYRARSETEDLASELMKLRRFLGEFRLNIEINGPGLTVLNRLKRKGFPMTRIMTRLKFDKKGNIKSEESVGWVMTQNYRKVIFDELRALVAARRHKILSPVVLEELQTLVRNSAGRVDHMNGCHDDTCIALGLAAITMNFMPGAPETKARHLRSKPAGADAEGQAKAPRKMGDFERNGIFDDDGKKRIIRRRL